MSDMGNEIFNMTQKEIASFRVINQTIDKVISTGEAAGLLIMLKSNSTTKLLMKSSILRSSLTASPD